MSRPGIGHGGVADFFGKPGAVNHIRQQQRSDVSHRVALQRRRSR
jgi:hypothetical protein